ncbi:MAG TPA: hypothetical protein DCZ03_07635 [Gammaproteobacteria bacterium]|nr:hypothetical protein [Gammaproteobacteria bacterium]
MLISASVFANPNPGSNVEVSTAVRDVTEVLSPSRGFLVERGYVATKKSFSVDLESGAFDTSGAVRLALPLGELILNGGLNGTPANEAVFKIDTNEFLNLNQGHIRTAAYFGVAHVDVDSGTFNTETEFTNFVLGAALSYVVDRFILDLNPEIELADDSRDDTIVNLGLGAYFDLGQTGAGRVYVGGELIIIEGGDDSVNEDVDDDLLSLGIRWIYKPGITIELMVVNNGQNDLTSIPGVVRLNLAL